MTYNLGKFSYHQPQSLNEACLLLQKLAGEATILNGGSDVAVRINQGLYKPHLVNIKFISALDYIKEDETGLRIGALSKLSAIAASPPVLKHFPVLVEAIKSIGTPQIRNLGTLSGNLCNASPVADSAPALLVLNARLTLQGVNGSREIALQDFHTGPGQTVLAAGELLTEIFIPWPSPGFSAVFGKHGPRKAADIAVVNVAMGLKFEEDICVSAMVALGAVAPTLIRARQTEAALTGQKRSEIDAAAAGALAAAEAKPISDIRGSLEYRREIVAVLVERSLLALLQ